MAEQAQGFLNNHPIQLYKDGLFCLRDAQNTIDALRGAGLITVATIKVFYGPFWIIHKTLGRIMVRHHAVVEVYKPGHYFVDPHALQGTEVKSDKTYPSLGTLEE